MKGKKIIASVLAVSMLSGTAVSLAACGGGSGGAYEYEIWLSLGENASYADYNENVAAKYWNSLEFKGEDGELHDTKVKFITAASDSAAKENFNTMMGSHNFYDVMDLAQSSYTAAELYQDGMLMDLTPYMEECMPNYLAWLEAHPTYGKTAVDYVGGEKKYLQIYAYQDFEECVFGWQYRRDWIAKYGKDKDGHAFTYSYDGGVLTDNVIFPSYYNEELRNSYNALLEREGKEPWDGTDPAFISDWEWMLDIFKTALTDLGIADGNSQTGTTGYPMSMYYPGYYETGDLVSAFGNTSGDFYVDESGKIQYGLTSENFKIYLKAMNGWYKNGWIDKVFYDRSQDMHYQININDLYAGRIGLFYGNGNTITNKLAKSDDKFLNGYFACGARQPINDKYEGTATVKYIPGTNEFLPRVFYTSGLEYSPFGLTVNLEKNGKDVKALLRMIDYLYEKSYTDENGKLQPGGAMLKSGLTKEQYDTVKQSGDFYDRTVNPVNGKTIAETGVVELSEDGTEFVFVEGFGGDISIRNPSCLNRMGGLQQYIDKRREPFDQHIYDEWDFYTSVRLRPSFFNQLDKTNAEKYNTFLDNVRKIEIPGSGKLPSLIINEFNETKYEEIMYAVTRRGVVSITNTLQELYDKFYNN